MKWFAGLAGVLMIVVGALLCSPVAPLLVAEWTSQPTQPGILCVVIRESGDQRQLEITNSPEPAKWAAAHNSRVLVIDPNVKEPKFDKDGKYVGDVVPSALEPFLERAKGKALPYSIVVDRAGAVLSEHTLTGEGQWMDQLATSGGQ